MKSIRSTAAFERAMQDPIDPDLRRLLTLRRDLLLAGTDADLGDLVHIIVAGRDTLAAIEAEAGFPLTGDDAPVEWVQRHAGGWLEVAIMAGDDFAVAIFVRDCICMTDPRLLLELLAHA